MRSRIRPPQYNAKIGKQYRALLNSQVQLMRKATKPVQNWRRAAMAPAMTMNNKRLILQLYQANGDNPLRVNAALKQLASYAQQQLQQLALTMPITPNQAITPNKPLSADDIRFGLQLDPSSDPLFNQQIDAQAQAQLEQADLEQAIIVQQDNELTAEELAAAQTQFQRAIEHQKQELTSDEDHPIRHELEGEAAVEGLIKLAQRPTLGAGISAELEKLLAETAKLDLAKSAIPRFVPPAA